MLVPQGLKPLLGAHLSIAGGYDKAIDRALALGCSVLQLFTHNPRRWKVAEPREAAVRLFRQKQRDTGILLAAHASYLVNLVSQNPDVREKSFGLFVKELELASMLGIPFIILHPGNCGDRPHTEAISELSAILDRAFSEADAMNVSVLLETSCGAGGVIGTAFEELRDVIAASRSPGRLGVCFDTCHVFSSGYDLRTRDAYEETMASFDDVCGADTIGFIHLNDSKGALGSKKDRHEHIGKGEIGPGAFELLMNDKRFEDVGKCIETPKGKDDGRDRMNLDSLRRLIKKDS